MTQGVEDSHFRDRSTEVFRERIESKVREMEPEELIDLAVDVATALDSMAAIVASMSQDMAQDRSWAWIYGILLGWDEVADSVAKRHEWDEHTRDRMVAYNVSVEKLINDTRGPRV